jgi:NADH-quinone oxidoreductase subunit J
MSSIFFWTASSLMLVFALAVIVNRNPVASALSLVVSFLGLAALFMTLDAFFIGIIQVLVYAGAVMVLFLFIIMLLDLRAEERRRINFVAFVGGLLVALIFFFQVYLVIGHLRGADLPFPAMPVPLPDDVHRIGLLLFSSYNLPFQIIGVLILVATVGVIVLSKRELR